MTGTDAATASAFSTVESLPTCPVVLCSRRGSTSPGRSWSSSCPSPSIWTAYLTERRSSNSSVTMSSSTPPSGYTPLPRSVLLYVCVCVSSTCVCVLMTFLWKTDDCGLSKRLWEGRSERQAEKVEIGSRRTFSPAMVSFFLFPRC